MKVTGKRYLGIYRARIQDGGGKKTKHLMLGPKASWVKVEASVSHSRATGEREGKILITPSQGSVHPHFGGCVAAAPAIASLR